LRVSGNTGAREMRIRILGAGLYGVHLASALLRDGHDVAVHEIADRIFAGATGNIPARLHQGQHYSRSKLTRLACQEHYREFMAVYGDFTHGIPVNIYAIAEHDSLVDFGTYRQVLADEIEFITVERPAELGLAHVEGAILTGERHVLVDKLAAHFAEKLSGVVRVGMPPLDVDSNDWDLTIDCSSCANDGNGVDRYEACLTLLLHGPTDKAVTICDGKYPSLYPWDEQRGLSSLTSAKWTPMMRTDTWQEARAFLDGPDAREATVMAAQRMLAQMAEYYPRLRDEYRLAEPRVAIRAMPRSAADARLVDIIRVGKRAVRVRAGKLDAIFHAERTIKAMLPEFGE
jgi:hypothetical protein